MLTQRYYPSLPAQLQRLRAHSYLLASIPPPTHPAALIPPCTFAFSSLTTPGEKSLYLFPYASIYGINSIYSISSSIYSIDIHYCLKHKGRKSPVPKCRASKVPTKQLCCAHWWQTTYHRQADLHQAGMTATRTRIWPKIFKQAGYHLTQCF